MIVNNLSKIMGIKRMKPAELQKLTGLSKDTIYKLYYDKKRTVKLDTINRLCFALNCNTQELFEYIPD